MAERANFDISGHHKGKKRGSALNGIRITSNAKVNGLSCPSVSCRYNSALVTPRIAEAGSRYLRGRLDDSITFECFVQAEVLGKATMRNPTLRTNTSTPTVLTPLHYYSIPFNRRELQNSPSFIMRIFSLNWLKATFEITVSKTGFPIV